MATQGSDEPWWLRSQDHDLGGTARVGGWLFLAFASPLKLWNDLVLRCQIHPFHWGCYSHFCWSPDYPTAMWPHNAWPPIIQDAKRFISLLFKGTSCVRSDPCWILKQSGNHWHMPSPTEITNKERDCTDIVKKSNYAKGRLAPNDRNGSSKSSQIDQSITNWANELSW